MTYLVTGAAGFIGYFVCRALVEAGQTVIGVDSLNDYYRIDLKESRLRLLENLNGQCTGPFIFFRGEIENSALIEQIFSSYSFDCVIHLAAQAGVRYSLTHPRAYVSSNVDGFLNILEGCRDMMPRIRQNQFHLVFASSSSVYGMNRKVPFSESDPTDHPVSLYAATKKADEMMAHVYSHLYGIPATGVRFFTVYGPMGRPDMAYFKFANAIMQEKTIDVYNNGNLLRDFTYIDDVIKAILLIAARPPEPAPDFDPEKPLPDRSSAPYRIYNIGNAHPEKLTDFITLLEKQLGREAKKNFLPMQPGDVFMTAADTSLLEHDFGWRPATPLETGLRYFTDWYKEKKIWQR